MVTKRSEPVRHPTFTTTSLVSSRLRAAVRTDEQPHMVRGLMNGILLSLAIWLAAAYVAFILR
jgi:hypothetical protein